MPAVTSRSFPHVRPLIAIDMLLYVQPGTGGRRASVMGLHQAGGNGRRWGLGMVMELWAGEIKTIGSTSGRRGPRAGSDARHQGAMKRKWLGTARVVTSEYETTRKTNAASHVGKFSRNVRTGVGVWGYTRTLFLLRLFFFFFFFCHVDSGSGKSNQNDLF